ncbi:YbaY family lipoprotein [Paludibacterium yongneupense]|uniref:YbaY family lipoprotein n=1 Tax=Paludibacterium yongneupense TaxID=400061 RepID=UPI00041D0592|nr:YbaY family lipoprotein [Paludibacterium yongneupense]
MMHDLARRLLIAGATVWLAACASTGHYQPATVSGQVISPVALPAATTAVQIRLLDVSRDGAPARLLAEQTLERPARFPAPFSLIYDRQAVKSDGHYQLEVEIFVDGQLRLQSPHAAPVDLSAAHPVAAIEVKMLGVK